MGTNRKHKTSTQKHSHVDNHLKDLTEELILDKWNGSYYLDVEDERALWEMFLDYQYYNIPLDQEEADKKGDYKNNAGKTYAEDDHDSEIDYVLEELKRLKNSDKKIGTVDLFSNKFNSSFHISEDMKSVLTIIKDSDSGRYKFLNRTIDLTNTTELSSITSWLQKNEDLKKSLSDELTTAEWKYLNDLDDFEKKVLTEEQQLQEGFSHFGPLKLGFGKVKYKAKQQVMFVMTDDETGEIIDLSENEVDELEPYAIVGTISLIILLFIYTSLVSNYNMIKNKVKVSTSVETVSPPGRSSTDAKNICDKTTCAVFEPEIKRNAVVSDV